MGSMPEAVCAARVEFDDPNAEMGAAGLLAEFYLTKGVVLLELPSDRCQGALSHHA